jgi:glyoxylase-like metal-dependent hydrolase (beta-lactamase superfamily II)
MTTTPLHHMDDAWRTRAAGPRLDAVRATAPRLKDAIASSGKPTGVRTFDLVTFPYPSKFGLMGASLVPYPFLMMRNRMQIVQFLEGSKLRTLLVNPSDWERGEQAPFFAKQLALYGEVLSKNVFSTRHATVTEALTAAGIRPESVDYITFDHLHVQDLRRLLGSSDGEPALLPNAVLLAQREELDTLAHTHPLHRHWYVDGGLRGVDPRKLVALEGDVLVGPGVALVRTPGHTMGNHSIVLHTDAGVWTISENGISADAYVPSLSRIPGVKRWAAHYDVDVILNGNTRESSLDQYTSMTLEKLLADPSHARPDIPQTFPSSEMVPHPLAPGLRPTLLHGAINHGALDLRAPAPSRLRPDAAASPSR